MEYYNSLGITASEYFDVNQPETIENYINPNTKILYAESPTNPAVDILDLAGYFKPKKVVSALKLREKFEKEYERA